MSNVSIAQSDFADQSRKVPLIQFWDKDIPDVVAELVQGVASVNSELDYQLFDDQSAAEFIRVHFGSDTLKLYRNCAIPAMRADLFRYCFLVKEGGFYIDADYRAVGNIDPVVYSSWRASLYQREKGLANGMMYFRDAEDPLAEKVLQSALYNIGTRMSNNVWSVTGPNVLRNIYANEANKTLFDNVHLMAEDEFAQYFKTVPSLDYKKDDSHWLVARVKGLDIFRH
ncbi:MAG: glycosyltransferase family 32 protein [Granulosicoccus sp.]